MMVFHKKIQYTYINSLRLNPLHKYTSMCKDIEEIKRKYKSKRSSFVFYPRKAISQKIDKNQNDLYNELMNKFL